MLLGGTVLFTSGLFDENSVDSVLMQNVEALASDESDTGCRWRRSHDEDDHGCPIYYCVTTGNGDPCTCGAVD